MACSPLLFYMAGSEKFFEKLTLNTNLKRRSEIGFDGNEKSDHIRPVGHCKNI